MAELKTLSEIEPITCNKAIAINKHITSVYFFWYSMEVIALIVC